MSQRKGGHPYICALAFALSKVQYILLLWQMALGQHYKPLTFKSLLLFDTRIIKAYKSESLINGENSTTRIQSQPFHLGQSHCCALVSVCHNRLFHGHMRLARGHTSH